MSQGIKVNYGKGPDGKKYSKKKERSPADDNSDNHHRVCCKMVHKQ